MKKSQKTPDQKFSFVNRFLVGLVIALSFSLTAFEWTSVKYHEIIEEDTLAMIDDDVILDPLRFRIEEAKKPEPIKEKPKTPKFRIVKTITDPEPRKINVDPEPKPITKVIVPELPPEILPDDNLPVVTAEFFAHYDKCAGLDSDELFQCTTQDIINRIKKNFIIPNDLKYDKGQKEAYISFVVSKKGKIKDIKVLRTNHPKMGEASIEALKKLPDMNPATQKGRKVALRMTVPIKLSIQ